MNPKLNKHPVLQALCEECEALSVPHRVELPRSGHPRLYVEVRKGVERFVVFSLTPSDQRRAGRNALQALRRVLGRRTSRAKAPRSRERRDTCRPDWVEPQADPVVRDDPFAVLMDHPQYAAGDAPV